MMPTRYEIQCPNCGNALVLPADNPEELQEYYRITKGTPKQCPACRHTFEGLPGGPYPGDSWDRLVDVDGSRFNQPREDLETLFEHAKEHKYLVREGDHCRCPAAERED